MDNETLNRLISLHVFRVDTDQPDNYCGDISKAWEVVEKMNRDENLHCELDCGVNSHTDKPYVTVHFRTYGYGSRYFSAYEKDTAPMAICLAALKAKGVEIDGKNNL